MDICTGSAVYCLLNSSPAGQNYCSCPQGGQKGGISYFMERKNKGLLVVEDDRDLRYLLSVKLVSAGYMVYGAANGLEALEQMEKHSIDAVLTDYHMPKM